MATVINNPSSDSSSTGAGWAVAIVLAIIVILALLFGIPALRDSGTPAVSVPDTIDVNIGAGGGQQ